MNSNNQENQIPSYNADYIANYTDRVWSDWGSVKGPKTYTGTQTFLSSGLELNNPANTFQYIFAGAAIVADRTVTMPLLTGNDTFVTQDFAQALTNKTINGSSNTITNVSLTTAVTGVLPAENGGTGVANNAASTITISGNFATTFTVTGNILMVYSTDTSFDPNGNYYYEVIYQMSGGYEIVLRYGLLVVI